MHSMSFLIEQRTEFEWRVNLFCMILLLAALLRVVVMDWFVKSVFDSYPVCFIYCSNTRQFAMGYTYNALLFTTFVCYNSSLVWTFLNRLNSTLFCMLVHDFLCIQETNLQVRVWWRTNSNREFRPHPPHSGSRRNFCGHDCSIRVCVDRVE